MAYIITSATENDFPNLLKLFKEFAEFENLGDKLTNNLQQMLAEKDYFNCLIAKNSDGIIVGYATYFYAYYTWSGKSLYMDDLYIKAAHRSKGLGTKLINSIIKLAKEANCHKVRWQVSNWNKQAITFYKSLGAEINTIEQNCDISI